MRRPCQHPHRNRGGLWLADIPPEPISRRQLLLRPEGPAVPYCGIDNARAMAAARRLGDRHLMAGICQSYAVIEGDDWALPQFALPQLVLAHALAEAEERFCVADHIRQVRLPQLRAEIRASAP